MGDSGIEPLTSSVSTKRSTSELTAQFLIIYTEFDFFVKILYRLHTFDTLSNVKSVAKVSYVS